MSTIKVSSRVAAALVCATAIFAWPAAARAGKNTIRSVESKDVNGTTKILVRGSSTPTFTVYKLERPARVVVNIASSKMAGSLAADDGKATWRINSWAVGDVAMHPLAGAGASVTRVVVNLARPATYKVNAHGDDVLVIVTPRDPPPKRANGSADVARARAETAAARKRAAEASANAQAAQQSVVAARAETAAARAEAERARRAASEAEHRAAAEKARAIEAQRAIAAAKADAGRARAEMTAAKQRAEKQVASARAEASTAMAESKKRSAEAEARMAAAAKRVEEAERRLAQVSALERRAKSAEATARAALKEAGDARSSATEAQKLAETRRAEAERAAAEATRYRTQAQSAQTDSKKARALEQRAAEAARDAEARRQRAEHATAEAEARRLAAEKAAAEAEHRKSAATAAAAAAEAERSKVEHARQIAESERARAETEHAEAEKRRRLAEHAAAEATQRAAAARALREKEEAAYRKASTARAEAENRRAEAERATARLGKSIAAARAAQSAADARRKEAVAAREHAEAEKRRARSSKAATAAEADAARLEKLVASADKALAARKAEVERRRQQAATLDARRDAAARDLKQLLAAASSARDDRQAEEGRLAELLRRRAGEEKQLEAARKARLEAEKRAAEAERQAKAAEDRAASAAAVAAKAKADTARAKADTARAKADTARAKAAAANAKPRSVAKPRSAAKATPATRVRNVSFSEHGGSDRVTIALSAPAHPVVSAHGNQQILELDDAAIARDLERTLDTRKYGGPVRAVSSYRSRKDPHKVLVVVNLGKKTRSRLVRVGNDYHWEFVKSRTQVASAPRRAPRAHAQNIPAPVIGGYGSSSTPVAQQTVAQIAPRGRKVYRGTKIDLDFKDADIHNLLRLLADVGGVSIVIPDEIKYRVTVRMRRVPWDQALEVILASKGLWYERSGNLLRIAPRKDLDAEAQADAERRAALIQQEVPQPEYITLNYASAKRVEPQVKQMLSPKGQLQIDDRTNTVVVIDVKANRKNIASLLTRLDTPTPQIQIEARIVEARSTFVREIGVQWGGNAVASGATGNSTGLIFPNSIGVAGGAVDNQTVSAGVVAPSDFAINLPAAVGSGAGGALGISLGSVGGNFNLNLRLSALEDQGTVRIVSAPKITVVNNVTAKISSGVSIPISVISANGVNTQFVPADLSLEVTPSVSQRDCAITMDVSIKKNEADFVNTGARGDPTILRKEANTRILVADGATTVVGGIYTRNTGLSYSKVPFFGDLPVVGWLFKKRRENDNRTELLVFITPKITNKASLRCE